MNNDINSRLETLSGAVDDAVRKAEKSLRRTAFFYLLVIVVLVGYTIFAGNRLRQASRTEHIVELIADRIHESLPDIRQSLVAESQAQAPELARQTVAAAMQAIPLLEEMGEKYIDAAMARLVNDAIDRLTPRLIAIAAEKFHDPESGATVKNEKKMAAKMADALAGPVSAEIDKTIDAAFMVRLRSLRRNNVSLILRPEKKLTRREWAEKMAFVYWVYLAEHAESDPGFWSEAARLISSLKPDAAGGKGADSVNP